MGISYLNADLFKSLTADLTLLKIFMVAYLVSFNNNSTSEEAS